MDWRSFRRIPGVKVAISGAADVFIFLGFGLSFFFESWEGIEGIGLGDHKIKHGEESGEESRQRQRKSRREL